MPRTLTDEQATVILRKLGWRIRSRGEYKQAVGHFQKGWNLGPGLLVDEEVGPRTSAALRISESRRRAGKGTASPHFSFTEVRCKCRGRYDSCPRIVVLRSLLRALEELRAKAYPGGMVITSGFRCPTHNTNVGGASGSQHKRGSAVDVAYRQGWTSTAVARLRRFSGIGRSRSTRLVRHVDVRHNTGAGNLTHGTTDHPTIWDYAS